MEIGPEKVSRPKKCSVVQEPLSSSLTRKGSEMEGDPTKPKAQNSTQRKVARLSTHKLLSKVQRKKKDDILVSGLKFQYIQQVHFKLCHRCVSFSYAVS